MVTHRCRIVAVIAALALAGGCGGDSTETPGPASTPAEAAATDADGARRPAMASAAAALLVNRARRAQVSPGVPLIVAAVLRQSASAPERAVSAEPPTPTLTADNGSVVDVAWEYIGADAEALLPGGTLTLRWVVATPLPPGGYTVDWSLDGLFAVASPTPRLRSAAVRVLDNPTDDDELFFAELAVLQAQRRPAEVLDRIDARLAGDPEDLLALRVRAETLEQLDDRERARTAWLELLSRLQDKAEAERTGAEPEIGFWINARLEALGR